MRPGGAPGLQIREEVLSIFGGFDSHPLRQSRGAARCLQRSMQIKPAEFQPCTNRTPPAAAVGERSGHDIPDFRGRQR